MYRLLLILCLCASICNAQHIKVGKSHNINDTVFVTGTLAADMHNEAALMKSYFAVEVELESPTPSYPVTVSPTISYDGQYADIRMTDSESNSSFFSYKWDVGDNQYKVIGSYTTDGSIANLAMSKDAQFLVVTIMNSSSGRNVRAYKRNVDAWELLSTPSTDTPTPSGVKPCAISADGSRLVIENAGAMSVYNWSGTEYIAANAPDTDFHATPEFLQLSDDGGVLVAGFNVSGGATTMKSYKWSSGNNRFEITANPDSVGSSVTALSIAANGLKVIASFYTAGITGGDTRIYDWDSGDNRFEQAHTFSLRLPSMSSDGNVFVAEDLRGSLHLHRTVFYKNIGGVYTKLPVQKYTRIPIISGNGRYVITPYNTAFAVYADLVNIIEPAISPYIYDGTESAIGFLPGRGKTGDTKTITAIWAAPYLQ